MQRLAGWSCEGQDGLGFDVPDPGRPLPPLPKLKTVGYLTCPRCGAPKTAIQAGPGHRLYGVHWITTEGGVRIPCGASGARVCELPRTSPLPASVYECPHAGGYPSWRTSTTAGSS